MFGASHANRGSFMAKVTVAVPVYNEANLLAGSLETLRTQSFTDIEVLIFDNASTDATPQVAADFVARDARFRYFRQPENKGALRNYHDALLAASSPYFMWRACDDRCHVNYIETLYALLEQNPAKQLATGDVILSNLDGGRARTFVFPNRAGGPTLRNRTRYILGVRAGWFYGLYRRDAITSRLNAVMQVYPQAWGFDYLVLLPFLFDDLVIGTRATTFQQILKRIKTPGAPRRRRTVKEIDAMIDLRQRFLTEARSVVAKRIYARPARLFYGALLWVHAGKRLFRFRKVIMRKLTRSRQDD